MKFKSALLFFLIYSFALSGFSQSNAIIRNVDFNMGAGNRIVIIFDITNYRYNDKFNIFPLIYKASGEKINAKSFTGDLTNISGGYGKKIIWDIAKDNILLDDDIYVVVTGIKISEAEPDKIKSLDHVNRGECFFQSIIFPGWGSARLSGKTGHVVKGILGYSSIVASIVFYSRAEFFYNDYKSATYADTRDKYYNKTENYRKYALASAIGAGTIWGIDLISVLAIRKNSTLSSSIPQTNLGFGCNLTNSTPTFALRLNF